MRLVKQAVAAACLLAATLTLGIRLAPGLVQAEPLPPQASAPQGAPGKPSGPLRDSEMAKNIEQFVDQLAARDEFSGAVLLAKDGKPFFQKAWGRANVRYDVPNRVDTKFNLGSMNKMFTAVAIAQLVEKGKLSFDDKVGKHLPDYPNQEVREKVTLHHLLTHTSGLGSYWNAKYDATWPRIRTVQGFLATFAEEPPRFEPGARFEYSNAGFIVLGAVIEKASGMDYYDYVRENIFKPAGMNDTDCYEMDREVPNLAFGYTNNGPDGQREAGPRRSNLFLHSVRGGPAGGGFSTVQDLLRFHLALRAGKLLGAKMTETVLTGKVNMGGSGMQYGYGFGTQGAEGRRIVGHNGGAPGISAWLDMYWDSGYTVAALSNYDRGTFPVMRRAKEMLTQQPLASTASR